MRDLCLSDIADAFERPLPRNESAELFVACCTEPGCPFAFKGAMGGRVESARVHAKLHWEHTGHRVVGVGVVTMHVFEYPSPEPLRNGEQEGHPSKPT